MHRCLQSSSSSKTSTTVAALVLPPLHAVADPLTEADGRVGAMELDGAGRARCEPIVLAFGTPGAHTLGVVGVEGDGDTPDRMEGGFTHAPVGAIFTFFGEKPFPCAPFPVAHAAEPTVCTPRC
jgi:hypothetical protein